MLILLISLILSGFSSDAWASEELGKRLIQFDHGKARWLTAAEIRKISITQHLKGFCGGFMDITDFRTPPSGFSSSDFLLPLVSAFQIEDHRIRHPKIVNRLTPELSSQNLYNNVDTLTKFGTRFYKSDSGKQAALWIRDQFIALSNGRSDIKVELFEHPSWKQPSVIAKIKGTGPHADETVILGAHEDSINWFSSNNAPGADDDASGVSTVIEIFRVLAQSGYRPARTLEFITYAAEEVGLMGSQAISRKYKEDGRKVTGVMQFDMTLFPGDGEKMTLINDNVDPKLTQFTAMLIDEYVKIPWDKSECGFSCSDHASWTHLGYPTVFPFEAPKNRMNRSIHTGNDTLDKLDAAFGLHFAKLGLAFAIEMTAP